MSNPDNHVFKQDYLFIRVAFGEEQPDGSPQCDVPQDVAEFLSAASPSSS